MASAFSVINPIQTFNHTTIKNPSVNPSPSSFLGSAVNRRFISLNNTFPSASCTHRRSFIVAVFDVVKEKKTKSYSSTSNLLLMKEEGLEVYEDMVLGRSFEDMFMQFQSNLTLSLLFPLPYH